MTFDESKVQVSLLELSKLLQEGENKATIVEKQLDKVEKDISMLLEQLKEIEKKENK
ncbi:hypothetical protein KAFR_0K01140 [Kazachstania africana CBS 2517]|uniref:Uncharacterized protein n=1 Tax=Kazachstania africana (strain ATCC 22294 / BCRC 22015 / CBS 2517 / CECT 1963 / NBRC 1671 / NRRL Y-8276) TaxID=1071382 RepID=H2B1G9_KAZAF|nr:hypothetical protein KAFR_0K01140 [Kazachstania africana CBS 2517]CCF60469.1 hypothetical protein KAFR_0K01140 [Kazachstania africana CBS 2517]